MSTFLMCQPLVRAEDKTPNILFILIDDLGWMDLACQGNKLVETPNIDRFATQGMRFTDAYAAAPVCSPTRAAILTGKFPARLRITNHLPDRPAFTPPNAKLGPAEMLDHLPLEHVTIAERLKAAGYKTGFFGKWHLNSRGATQFYPEHQGFDLNVGGCAFGGLRLFSIHTEFPRSKTVRRASTCLIAWLMRRSVFCSRIRMNASCSSCGITRYTGPWKLRNRYWKNTSREQAPV